MTTSQFNLKLVDPSWQPCLKEALSKMNPEYLHSLYNRSDWLPGQDKIFNAFSIPFDQVKYVLFGESPYPRAQSANGYAFWDASVKQIWSEKGLSKEVNRATSLRNIIKMLLVAEGLLTQNHTSQHEIAALNKNNLIQTNDEFFHNFLEKGFLMLNISLVLQATPVKKDALAWQPFIKHVLHYLLEKKPNTKLILLGQIAHTIDSLLELPNAKKFYAEHPYNLSFIQNQTVLEFFRPLTLLRKAGEPLFSKDEMRGTTEYN